MNKRPEPIVDCMWIGGRRMRRDHGVAGGSAGAGVTILVGSQECWARRAVGPHLEELEQPWLVVWETEASEERGEHAVIEVLPVQSPVRTAAAAPPEALALQQRERRRLVAGSGGDSVRVCRESAASGRRPRMPH